MGNTFEATEPKKDPFTEHALGFLKNPKDYLEKGKIERTPCEEMLQFFDDIAQSPTLQGHLKVMCEKGDIDVRVCAACMASGTTSVEERFVAMFSLLRNAGYSRESIEEALSDRASRMSQTYGKAGQGVASEYQRLTAGALEKAFGEA